MCASGVFKATADPVALTLSRNEAPVTALVFRNRCPFRQEIQIKRTRQSDDRIYANNCATPFSWPAIYAGQLSVAMLARAIHFFHYDNSCQFQGNHRAPNESNFDSRAAFIFRLASPLEWMCRPGIRKKTYKAFIRCISGTHVSCFVRPTVGWCLSLRWFTLILILTACTSRKADKGNIVNL